MADRPNTAVDYLKQERVKNKSKFDGNKYNVNHLTYPLDLLSPKVDASGVNEYGDNYVIFYINVSESSKLIKQKLAKTVDIAAAERNRGIQQKRLAEMNPSKVTVATGLITAGAVTDTMAGVIGVDVGGTGVKAGIIASGILAAADIPSFTRPQKRLETAIALHIPNNLVTRYGMQWQDENNTAFTYAVTAGHELEELVKAAGKSIMSFNASAITQQAKKSSGVARDVLTNLALNTSTGLSTASGLAPNPNKEQVFSGVEFRQFTMEYQFFPKSPQEAESVQNIIQNFKYHMHPEFKDPNNFIYIYPSEFDIVFYNGSEENRNLHRHSSCVLVDMNINYTPNGIFNTFKGGVPAQINIALTFRELTQLTKENIAEGY
jgi:hypothetical protein